MNNPGVNSCKVVLLGESGKNFKLILYKVSGKPVLFLDLLITNLIQKVWQQLEPTIWPNQ